MFKALFRRWFPKPLTPAEQYLINYIQQHGRLYGSRKWGTPTTASDWDYCISYQQYRELYQHMDACSISYKHGYDYASILSVDSHIKFTLSDGTSYDVIAYISQRPKAIIQFNQACDIMDSFSTIHHIPDKAARHYYFKSAIQIVQNTYCKSTDMELFARTHYPELFI